MTGQEGEVAGDPSGGRRQRLEALAGAPRAPLRDDEARYVGAARAANTLRDYRSDWAEW